MATITLRPGYLVSLKTRLTGGVQYQRTDLNKTTEDSAESGTEAKVEEWKTKKITEDPEEFERAGKVRSKAGSLIRTICIPSEFGLLCPTAKKEALEDAIKEAKALVAAFNADAKLSRVSVYVIKGEIAESDTEAAQAVASELRTLMDTMRTGIETLDVEKIRDAANQAKKMTGMLDADAGKKVTKAIEEARSIAREITKKLVAKEDMAGYVEKLNLDTLAQARTAFLDMDEPAAVEGEALPSTEARGLELDMGEDGERMAASGEGPSRAIEC